METTCVIFDQHATLPFIFLLTFLLSFFITSIRHAYINRLISEIKGSADDRCKEEAALMMCTFLRASPLRFIVKPFIGTLINTLPLNADIRLTTASLEAVGELCLVVRDEILPYADQLMPQVDGQPNPKPTLTLTTLPDDSNPALPLTKKYTYPTPILSPQSTPCTLRG